MARVVLQNLVKTYPATARQGAFTAVKGISLEVNDGEFMVLVGPSGCGKSTTLRTIAGLEPVTSGSISIDERVVNDVPPRDRDIAMVFQNYALYPHMNVYDNMAFGLKLRKFPRPEIERRVREAAQLLGLDAQLARRPKELSGGQRQRVALGRAIVRQPKVFLFDEPLSNLDAKMRVAMRGEIIRLHERLGSTMIYVTHDQVEAMTMGDRICVMNDGHIDQIDEPLALYRRPRSLFTAGFIGSPPMNLLHGRIEPQEPTVIFRESGSPAVPLALPLTEPLAEIARRRAGQAAILGIRPEDIHEAAATDEPSRRVKCIVEYVEPMGAETLLHLSSGASTFVVRTHPATAGRAGQPLDVVFDLDRAHLFDPQAQTRLD
jgi:multiple sugar transport system ATP-binding protein